MMASFKIWFGQILRKSRFIILRARRSKIYQAILYKRNSLFTYFCQSTWYYCIYEDFFKSFTFHLLQCGKRYHIKVSWWGVGIIRWKNVVDTMLRQKECAIFILQNARFIGIYWIIELMIFVVCLFRYYYS